MNEARRVYERIEELERAIADLRQVVGGVVNHLAGGGHVKRGDALFTDLKRIHRHTRDVLAVKITGGASRWWKNSLGERVVMLEAELERFRYRAVEIDRMAEAGNLLGVLSDEVIAAELDRRAQTHVSKLKVDTYTDQLPDNLALYGEAVGAPAELLRTAAQVNALRQLRRPNDRELLERSLRNARLPGNQPPFDLDDVVEWTDHGRMFIEPDHFEHVVRLAIADGTSRTIWLHPDVELRPPSGP